MGNYKKDSFGLVDFSIHFRSVSETQKKEKLDSREKWDRSAAIDMQPVSLGIP